jgi:hypothetical protein
VSGLERPSTIGAIDRVPAQHYGFSDEELDFIINYVSKYRMGKGAEAASTPSARGERRINGWGAPRAMAR